MAKQIRITPEEFQEKHARRLKGSIQDISAGIDKVTEAPTAKAASKEQKMLANLNSAVQSGKWRNGLNRVTLDQWKMAAKNKGLTRIAAGIDGAKDKVVQFAGQLLAHEATLQQSINKMPDLTTEDSIARATAWIRGMVKFERK